MLEIKNRYGNKVSYRPEEIESIGAGLLIICSRVIIYCKMLISICYRATSCCEVNAALCDSKGAIDIKQIISHRKEFRDIGNQLSLVHFTGISAIEYQSYVSFLLTLIYSDSR